MGRAEEDGASISWENAKIVLSALTVVITLALAWGSLKEDIAKMRDDVDLLLTDRRANAQDHDILLQLKEDYLLEHRPH